MCEITVYGDGMTNHLNLITVQVFVTCDPAEAENVASEAADFITESFDSESEATVQTVLVHIGPFTFSEGGVVNGGAAYTGE